MMKSGNPCLCVDVEMGKYGAVRDPEVNVESNRSASEKRITRRPSFKVIAVHFQSAYSRGTRVFPHVLI